MSLAMLGRVGASTQSTDKLPEAAGFGIFEDITHMSLKVRVNCGVCQTGGEDPHCARTARAPRPHRVRYLNNFPRRWSTGRGVVNGTWWALEALPFPLIGSG